MRRSRTTRATRQKLEGALDLLDAFLNATNVAGVVDDDEWHRLEQARSEIADVEAELYRRARG